MRAEESASATDLPELEHRRWLPPWPSAGNQPDRWPPDRGQGWAEAVTSQVTTCFGLTVRHQTEPGRRTHFDLGRPYFCGPHQTDSSGMACKRPGVRVPLAPP